MISPRQALTAIGFCLGGLVYGLILRVICGGMTGAGHGTPLFSILSASPFGIGLFLWFFAGALIPFLHKKSVAILVASALVIHYIGAAVWWLGTDDYPFDALEKTWESVPFEVVIVSLIYISGQIFVWSELIRTQRKSLLSSVEQKE